MPISARRAFKEKYIFLRWDSVLWRKTEREGGEKHRLSQTLSPLLIMVYNELCGRSHMGFRYRCEDEFHSFSYWGAQNVGLPKNLELQH